MPEDTERKPWDRMEGEPNHWFQRFAFARTRDARSILSAFNLWQEEHPRQVQANPDKQVVSAPKSWHKASEDWSWKARWDAWDTHLVDQVSAETEAKWGSTVMPKVEVLGRLSEFGRNDISLFFKPAERWTENPLPSEEIVQEEQYDKMIAGGIVIPATRYLVRKVALNMDALLDPALSFRVKKFGDSPKNGLTIELYSAQESLVNLGKHHKLFDFEEDSGSDDTGIFSLPADILAPTFLDAYDDIKLHNHTEYVFHGGRGSTKSSFISLVIVWLIKNNPTMHGIAVRQVGNTLRDSVYSQIVWAINELGLGDQFKCTVSPLEIEYRPTGQKIYFRGADEPGKIKSIKPAFGYIGIAWFEELDQLHGPEAIRNIEQSAIRGGDLAYIFKSFNPPRSAANWVNKYIQIPKDNQYQHHSTYLELGSRVRWLGKPWVEEAEHLKLVNPKAYEHEYLGIANGTGGMVFENVQLRKITDEEIAQFDHVCHGLDFGFYPDPAHYTRMHFDAARRTLYIYGEVRRWKTSNRAMYDALVEYGLTPADTLICDSAEPKSVGDFREYGASARGAEKGPDSVSYSIKWMQSLVAIVIDNERCPYAAEEFLEYEYETDPDGNYISEYPDKNNHAIDSARYGTNLIWRKRGQ